MRVCGVGRSSCDPQTWTATKSRKASHPSPRPPPSSQSTPLLNPLTALSSCRALSGMGRVPMDGGSSRDHTSSSTHPGPSPLTDAGREVHPPTLTPEREEVDTVPAVSPPSKSVPRLAAAEAVTAAAVGGAGGGAAGRGARVGDTLLPTGTPSAQLKSGAAMLPCRSCAWERVGGAVACPRLLGPPTESLSSSASLGCWARHKGREGADTSLKTIEEKSSSRRGGGRCVRVYVCGCVRVGDCVWVCAHWGGRATHVPAPQSNTYAQVHFNQSRLTQPPRPLPTSNPTTFEAQQARSIPWQERSGKLRGEGEREGGGGRRYEPSGRTFVRPANGGGCCIS